MGAIGDESVLAAILTATGEAINKVSGTPTTKLTVALTAAATSATVETTYEFPEDGSLYLEDELVSYTGKTTTTFTGLVRGHGAAEHAAGTAVTDASQTYSQADKARGDMLLNRAAGHWLREAAQIYGESVPRWIVDDDYAREYVKKVAYLDRGPWYPLFQALDKLLYQFSLTGSLGQTSAGAPTKFYFNAAVLDARDTYRYFEIGSSIFRLKHVDSATTATLFTENNNFIVDRVITGDVVDASGLFWRLLPFWIHVGSNNPAVVKIYLRLQVGFTPHQSFIHPTSALSAVDGIPEGMIVHQGEDYDKGSSHPWYVGNYFINRLRPFVEPLLPAGVVPEFFWLG